MPHKVKWTEVHQKAFDDPKNALMSYSILRNPDFGWDFILQPDACARGYGAVLLQSDGKASYPIIFISKNSDNFISYLPVCTYFLIK